MAVTAGGTVPPASNTCSILLNAFDGTRAPISKQLELFVRVKDGTQKEVKSVFAKGPSVIFRGLQFFNNFGDNYTVFATAKGYADAGFYPVRVTPNTSQTVDLMLLGKKAVFNFAQAQWDVLKGSNPSLVTLLSHGTASDAAAKKRYTQLMEQKPESVASLLNIVTAMRSILLPVGSPFDYLKQLIWDESLARDRFFVWADAELVNQLKLAAAHGTFAPEPGAAMFHPGATLSYKQVQFGEANVQITFHQDETKTIDRMSCVKVEPDIDYYKDLMAHSILEVLPNLISKGKTDPKAIYVLRWIAGRHAGVPEFNPPYSIE